MLRFSYKQAKLLLIFICVLLPIQVVAAGPMTHVYLGLKWLDVYGSEYDEQQRQAFLIGTVFPDIRYIARVSRNVTHTKNVHLQDVLQAKSEFDQGVKFHSYVDNERFEFLKRHPIQKKISTLKEPHKSIYVKLVEDQMIYPKADWRFMKQTLFSPVAEEKQYDIDFGTITQWHMGLSYYFSMLPSSILSQIAMFDKGILMLDSETVEKWSVSIKETADDKNYQQYLTDLTDHIVVQMQKHQAQQKAKKEIGR